MAGWSSVAFLLLAFAAGWFVCDWQYQRAARIEAERQLVIAAEKPAVQVADERKLATVEANREQGKARARAGVERAPDLSSCPVPAELSELLVTQQQATRRATASGDVPNRPVP